MTLCRGPLGLSKAANVVTLGRNRRGSFVRIRTAPPRSHRVVRPRPCSPGGGRSLGGGAQPPLLRGAAVRGRPRPPGPAGPGRDGGDERPVDRRRQRQGPRPARAAAERRMGGGRSEEHTSELQSLMRISYAVFCLKNKKTHK